MQNYDDGQPVAGFNRSRRIQRTFHTLLGLLHGLVADTVLVEREVLCLDLWLRNHGQEIANDPDIVDLIDLLQDITTARSITQEQINDIHELIATVLEYRTTELDHESEDDMLQLLNGIILGMTADQQLNDKEITNLADWLINLNALGNDWTTNLLRQRLALVLADGIITTEERQELLDVLNNIVGGHVEQDGLFGGKATRAFLLDQPPENSIVFEGRKFSVTGKFLYGARTAVIAAIEQRGGKVYKDVTAYTDYLIVGTLASRDWVQATHGRKLQNMLEQQTQRHIKNGKPIRAIAEEEWILHLEKQPVLPKQEQVICIQPLTNGNVQETMLPHIESFIATGWHVLADQNSITLHRLGKRGRPLKTPTVLLQFAPENSHRQWRTKHDSEPAALSYSRFEDAAILFLEYARRPPQHG